ncbi:FAD-dependent oxidoreductase [Desulfatiglans anilini]|uniref:oxidoreductase n=1 Tax=Desulfatiglans anilini TaxID=90728 RepID=UPI0004272CCC|nr:FAD-dependent oxidoreductase [Desulfatiglans anilini]
MYELLNSPVAIGRLTLKNRVAMTAMGTNLGAPGGGVTGDIIAFYEERARGGIGLIITEITRVMDGHGAGMPNQLALRTFSDAVGMERLANTIHKYDAKIFVQLQHPGREAHQAMLGEPCVGPSEVMCRVTREMPRALTTRECEEIVERFVSGAMLAQMAGIDGIELHCAHGYLLGEFLSPHTNKRTDKYGGSFENRMRIVVEIMAGIRSRCGPFFPLCVRISAEEFLDDGVALPDGVEIARALERAGADCIDVSCGIYESPVPACVEPGTYEQGWKKYMPAEIKKHVKIPVIGVCNIKEPHVAEALLREGAVDIAGVARGHLADPEWCGKAFSGRADEIRKCIGCLACFGELDRLHHIKCAVNPRTGREREYEHPKMNGNGRTIALVGGGPAGIEAGLLLDRRGFRVVLFDRGERLGGTLNVADKGEGKEKITRLVDSLIALVEQSHIEVRLNTEADVDKVKALNPYGVFVACGASPIIPHIPGIIEGNHVVTAEDVLLGRAIAKGDCVVIGSGMTGLETAEVLISAGHQVTIVEMLDSIGPGVYPSILMDVMGRIIKGGAVLLPGHKLLRVNPDGVLLEKTADGSHLDVKGETIVLAMGVRPRKDVVDAFCRGFENVRVIGDAERGARILEATAAGYGKAFVFE